MEVTADAFKDNISPGSLLSVTDGHLSRNVSFLSLRNHQVRCSVCFDIILRPFWKQAFLWRDCLAWFFLAVLTLPILTASVLNFSNYVWWFGGPRRHPSSEPVTNSLLRKRSCRYIMLELTFSPYRALEWGMKKWFSACLASTRTCFEFDPWNLYEKLDVVACACFSCAGETETSWSQGFTFQTAYSN